MQVEDDQRESEGGRENIDNQVVTEGRERERERDRVVRTSCDPHIYDLIINHTCAYNPMLAHFLSPSLSLSSFSSFPHLLLAQVLVVPTGWSSGEIETARWVPPSLPFVMPGAP
jgi:hypothetical protein